MKGLNGADVVVVGAGIAGIATAWELVWRGVDVLVIDRAGVSEGTTGLGEGNALCCDKPGGPALELARHGLALFDEIEDRWGDVAAIRRKGSLVVPPDLDALDIAAAHAAQLTEAGVDAEVVDSAGLRQLEPELSWDLQAGVLVPGDLQCDPQAITRAMARDLAAAGGRVVTGREVTALIEEGDRIAGVALHDGVVDARAVVISAGAWSAPLAASVGLHLPVEPRKGQVLRTEPAPSFLRRKVLDGAYLSSVASDEAALSVASVLETAADGGVLIGSSRERRGFDLTVDAVVTEALLERARRFAPRIAELQVVDAWAGLRPYLPDHLPAVGRSAVLDGLWACTGHEGSGVSLGPISGRLCAQLICGEDPVVDPTPFDPDRFARTHDAA